MQWMISEIDSIGMIGSKRAKESQPSKGRPIVIDAVQSRFQKRLLAEPVAKRQQAA